jgi:hypothetical protein
MKDNAVMMMIMMMMIIIIIKWILELLTHKHVTHDRTGSHTEGST